jgi:hypothetical protein
LKESTISIFKWILFENKKKSIWALFKSWKKAIESIVEKVYAKFNLERVPLIKCPIIFIVNFFFFL